MAREWYMVASGQLTLEAEVPKAALAYEIVSNIANSMKEVPQQMYQVAARSFLKLNLKLMPKIAHGMDQCRHTASPPTTFANRIGRATLA